MDVFAVEALSPAQDLLKESGSTLTVTCRAPAGAAVTAVVGGQAVAMRQSSVGGSGGVWTAATYTGSCTLPTAEPGEILSLGQLRVFAVLGETAAEADGPLVRVRGEGAVLPIRVTADDAELKLGLNTYYYDDFSVQSAGMTDYAVWQGNGMYLLRVGGYVYEKDCEELPPGTEIPVAEISSVRAVREGTDVAIRLGLSGNVPHNGTLRDGAFELTLYNVNAASAPTEPEMEDNPLFSSVGILYPPKDNCVRYRFELKDPVNFYGFDFVYGEEGATVLLRCPRGLPATETPLAGVTVVLDAGHGGADSGARGPLHTEQEAQDEKDLNLAVTLAAADALRALGAEVILTREDDSTVPIMERVERLIGLRPDLAISLHHNSLDYTADVRFVRGTLGLWWADGGELLADCLAQSVASALSRPKLTTSRQKLALCRNPKFPSALIEIGFMTNAEEYEFMLNGGAQRAADGIADGVLRYFAVQAAFAAGTE
jgi:N-acetylmuramoyl-L-alanine amidase